MSRTESYCKYTAHVKKRKSNYIYKIGFTRVNSFSDYLTGQSDAILSKLIVHTFCRIILSSYQNYHITLLIINTKCTAPTKDDQVHWE